MIYQYKSVCHNTQFYSCYVNYLQGNNPDTGFAILTKYNNVSNKYSTHYLGYFPGWLINANECFDNGCPSYNRHSENLYDSEIWDSRDGEYWDYGLLGHDAV